jgi:hypothetical protein
MTKFTPSVFLGFLITLLLFACSAEDNMTQSSTNNVVEETKTWFETDSNKTNLKIIDYVKEIQWDDAIVTNGEKGQIIEVPITLLDFVTTTNKKTKEVKRLNDYHRLLFMKTGDKTYKCYDLQIFTNGSNFDNLDKNFNYYSIKDNFNGFVTIYDPVHQKVNTQEFKNGKRPIHKLTALMDAYEECTYLGWWYEDGSFEVIALLYCSGGGGEGGFTGGYGGGGDGRK